MGRSADEQGGQSEWRSDLKFGLRAAGVAVAAVVAVLLVVIGLRYARHPSGLHLTQLDFGTAWVRPDFRWTVPVENRSDHVIVIEDVDAGCDCTSASPTSFTLAPGARQELTLLMD
ncbi:MAG: DUF1573 domain-containing protein [Planctomycetaceae bacterium]